MDKIKVLFITEDITKYDFDLPEWMEKHIWKESLLNSKDYFQIVVIDRNVSKDEASTLFKICRAYCMFYPSNTIFDANTRKLIKSRCGKALSMAEIEDLLCKKGKDFFAGSYGEKYDHKDIGLSSNFNGEAKWYGQYCVNLDGEYGDEFNQIVFWKYNIPMEAHRALDLWLEYVKDDTVEIKLEIKKLVNNSFVEKQWEFCESEMNKEMCIENNDTQGILFFSLKARGYGNLKIIDLHSRYSRRGLGTFYVGGERYVTSKREEIFAYFDPGDFKPPLAVYFSGYKTLEGFEGYYLLRKRGCPFLLIADQRLEGGALYIGDEEYEKLMVSIIKKYLNKLGFWPDQLILSGISMGSTGAIYYGCNFIPHSIIVGKPLIKLADIALNEKLKRPGGYKASLDMLQYHGYGISEDYVEELNKRVIEKIRSFDFKNTKFIVAYMYEDDYDSQAYGTLLSELNYAGVQIYGKGLHGRHNDNSEGINAWFKSQYDRILMEDFGR